MFGLERPDIYSSKQRDVLCIQSSVNRDSYATLYCVQQSLATAQGNYDADSQYYGLSTWTMDEDDSVFCNGISPPLKSNNNDSIIPPGLCIAAIVWKYDSSQLCAFVNGNVYFMETVGSSLEKRTKPIRLRSIGALYLPMACAITSTGSYLLFGMTDGTIHQYCWDMTAVSLICLSNTSLELQSWPPSSVIFQETVVAEESSLRVYHRTPQPVSFSWKQSCRQLHFTPFSFEAVFGAVILQDGSFCLIDNKGSCLPSSDTLSRDGMFRCSQRYTISGNSINSTRKILHTVFVEHSSSSEWTPSASSGDSGSATYYMVCLTVTHMRAETNLNDTRKTDETQAKNSFPCLELVMIALTCSTSTVEGIGSASAVLSITSRLLLAESSPYDYCIRPKWSNLIYPFSSSFSERIQYSAFSSARSDQLFVTLGGRIFCVRLQFRSITVTNIASRLFDVAPEILFSVDMSNHICNSNSNPSQNTKSNIDSSHTGYKNLFMSFSNVTQ